MSILFFVKDSMKAKQKTFCLIISVTVLGILMNPALQ